MSMKQEKSRVYKNPRLSLYSHAGLQLEAGGLHAARLQMSEALQR